MKIGFYLADQNPARDRSLGITSYTVDLLSHLDKEQVQVHSLISSSSVAWPDADSTERIPWSTEPTIGRILADNFHNLWCWNEHVDLIHYPKGYVPIGKSHGKPVVTTIHDAILDYYHIHYRETRSRADWIYWLHQLKRAIETSDAIITISETSKSQILNFAKKYSLRVPAIHVTYEGSRFERHFIARKSMAPSPKQNHVVLMASKLPHKGTTKLLGLWKDWVATRHDPPILKIIGQLPDDVRPFVKEYTHIQCLPFQSEPDLIQVISTARGVIIPSEIEGFGLPILESFYLGTPAIAVQDTSCHEILNHHHDAAFDLDTPSSFSNSMSWMLQTTDQVVNTMAEDLYARFNWDTVARKTLDVYRATSGQ